MAGENGSNGKSPLTREQILAAIDMKIEAVDCPEWDGTVYVRNLSGMMRDEFDRSRVRLKGKEIEIVSVNTRATLLSKSICDKDGKLLFSEADIEALGEKNGAVLDRLFDVAQRLSGLRKEDVEERAKN